MIVKFFGKTYPITIVVLVIIALATQLPCVIFPGKFFVTDHYSPIINLIRYLYKISPFLSSSVLLVCFFACLFTIDKINTNNLLISKTSLLPPIVFALLFQFQLYNPALIANMLVLISINRLLNINSQEENAYNEVDFFAAGFMVGIATLTDLPAVLFLLFIIIAVFVIGAAYKFRDILIIITGFTLPLIIWLFIEFVSGDINSTAGFFNPLKVNFEIFRNIFSITDYIFIGYIVLLIIISIIFVYSKLYKMNIALRNKYLFFIIIMVISLILVVIFNYPITYLLMSLPILSILLSYLMINIKSFWADILFCLLAIIPAIYTFINA
ncbi:MAG: hypothetical protein LBP67_04485 [Bacteroidales bacterium]|jgi:hypothetical protein|nr:hypothetical protein [Bacteroidales bacterium]